MNHPQLTVIIVTHKSGTVIKKCLDSLFQHCSGDDMDVCVVDSASPDTAYLTKLKDAYPDVHLLLQNKNVGFCLANNIGYRALQQNKSEFVLFLNPDAFITADLLPKLIARMQQPEWADVAVCTPLLLGYSLKEDKPSGLIDSAGIGMSSYGRFFDRGQGSSDLNAFSQSTEVEGVCGAFMLCRRAALDAVSPNGEVFDESFYMYKEDVDLSLRLRRAGGRLMLCADLAAYHCRGWLGSRAQMPRWTITQSIRNDWRVWWKFKIYLLPNSILSFFYLSLKSVIVATDIWLVRGLLKKGN